MRGLERGSIRCKKGKVRHRGERDRDVKGRRQQQSEFIFINGQRAERELLKKREMNEGMSEIGGGRG